MRGDSRSLGPSRACADTIVPARPRRRAASGEESPAPLDGPSRRGGRVKPASAEENIDGLSAKYRPRDRSGRSYWKLGHMGKSKENDWATSRSHQLLIYTSIISYIQQVRTLAACQDSSWRRRGPRDGRGDRPGNFRDRIAGREVAGARVTRRDLSLPGRPLSRKKGRGGVGMGHRRVGRAPRDRESPGTGESGGWGGSGESECGRGKTPVGEGGGEGGGERGGMGGEERRDRAEKARCGRGGGGERGRGGSGRAGRGKGALASSQPSAAMKTDERGDEWPLEKR